MKADGCGSGSSRPRDVERVGVPGCDLKFETGGSCEEGAEVAPAQDGMSAVQAVGRGRGADGDWGVTGGLGEMFMVDAPSLFAAGWAQQGNDVLRVPPSDCSVPDGS